MARGMGYSPAPVRLRDLTAFAGTWEEDPDFDRAIVEQDAIDDDLWK